MNVTDRSRMLALVGGLAVFARSNPTEAAPRGTFELDWEAPAGCPSQNDVHERLRALVGESFENAGGLRAEGKVIRRNRRYHLTLRVSQDDADTVRVVESDSCTALAGAAAVALGLLIRSEVESRSASTDQQGQESARPPASRSDSSSGSSAPAPPKRALVPAPPPRRAGALHTTTNDSSRWRLVLRAPLVGIDAGPFPRPTPTLGFAAGARFEAFEATLGARLALSQTISVDGEPPYGAEVGRTTGELRTCYALRMDQLSVAPCLFVGIDRLTSRGTGAEVSAETRHAAVFAAGLGGVASINLGASWALVAVLGAQAELSRPHLVVDGLGEVAQVAPFAFNASAGIEWSP